MMNSSEPADATTPSRKWRVALYSHDTMGIGHMRRNLLIAQALAGSSLSPSILLIAGAREAGAFPLPPGVDCLTVPSLAKEGDGRYYPRDLDLSLQTLIELRAGTIRAALGAFDPHVLVVDKVPRGALGELDGALAALRARGTRCVLGLREVLDEPDVVRREWAEAGNDNAVRAYYDAVWVYADPAVYDPVREYGFAADVAAKVRYTGYFDQRTRLRFAPGPGGDVDLPPGRLVMCMVGGGQDGAPLAEAFAGAELPPDACAVLVTGPFMPPEVQDRLRRRADGNHRLRVVEFLLEPERLLSRADRVVAMGGYNTVGEVLSFEKHALIVPRVRPRREQFIRAERLRELGLVHVLHPDAATPAALSAWLARDLGPPPDVHGRIDFGGLARLPRLLAALLAAPLGSGAERQGNDHHPPSTGTRSGGLFSFFSTVEREFGGEGLGRL
jgi:predicted glycosyltransferase